MTRRWMGLLIVAGMAGYSVLVLPALPAEIPIHWNLSGEPDSTMAKALGAFLMVLVGIGVWLLFVGISPLLPRISSNWWTGIRTPWTLSNETVWRRTHRVGGYMSASAGLLIVATAFLPHPARLWVSALMFLAMVMIPMAYSYFI